MNHADHVRLLKKAIPNNSGGVWTDFGSGEGAFTLAIRDLAGDQAKIYSIDKDSSSLNRQKKKFEEHFPKTDITYIVEDFTKPLKLPQLDGFVAANSIHFQKDTTQTLLHLMNYLKPTGIALLVEYNVDIGNKWVPYPFSFTTLRSIANKHRLSKPELLDTHPSNFLEEIYSASLKNKG